jgi:hypothetical protein
MFYFVQHLLILRELYTYWYTIQLHLMAHTLIKAGLYLDYTITLDEIYADTDTMLTPVTPEKYA